MVRVTLAIFAGWNGRLLLSGFDANRWRSVHLPALRSTARWQERGVVMV